LKVLAFPGPKHELPAPEVEEVVPPPAPPRHALEDDVPQQYDRITIRAITVAIVLSLFVHILVLVSPWMNSIDKEQKAPADENGPLSVSIATPPPPPSPVKQEAAAEQPAPKQQKPVAKPKPTPPQPRSQLAVNTGRTPPFVIPPPTTAQPPTPEAAPTPQPVVPTTEDFSEQLAARQMARRAQNGGAPDEVVESENERANRIAKGNMLAQQRSASPGQDPNQSGGIFDLRRTGLNEAEFIFNGWNRDFRRGVGKSFEVKTGNNSDIRIAVIRQMIEIIREQQPGDFEWYGRDRRSIVMSARVKDQPELEIFLMKEFYPQDPRAQDGHPPSPFTPPPSSDQGQRRRR
jgi:hypothetical protein